MSALNRDCYWHDASLSLSRQQVKVSKRDGDRERTRECDDNRALPSSFPHGSPMQSDRDMTFAAFVPHSPELSFWCSYSSLPSISFFSSSFPLPFSLFSLLLHPSHTIHSPSLPSLTLHLSHPPPLFINSFPTIPTPSTFTTLSSCVPPQPFLPPSSSPSPPSRLRMLPPSPRPPSLAMIRPALPWSVPSPSARSPSTLPPATSTSPSLPTPLAPLTSASASSPSSTHTVILLLHNINNNKGNLIPFHIATFFFFFAFVFPSFPLSFLHIRSYHWHAAFFSGTITSKERQTRVEIYALKYQPISDTRPLRHEETVLPFSLFPIHTSPSTHTRSSGSKLIATSTLSTLPRLHLLFVHIQHHSYDALYSPMDPWIAIYATTGKSFPFLNSMSPCSLSLSWRE